MFIKLDWYRRDFWALRAMLQEALSTEYFEIIFKVYDKEVHWHVARTHTNENGHEDKWVMTTEGHQQVVSANFILGYAKLITQRIADDYLDEVIEKLLNTPV